MAFDEIWEDIFSSSAWGKYPGEALIRFVARHFYKANNRRDIRILELGCGPGANLWYCAREEFSVFGVDGSKTAIRIAKARLDTEVPDWTGALCVADISLLPFDDKMFDAVIDNEAICCNSFEDSQIIYSEAARVLKTSGKLFSRTFSTLSWGYGTGQELGRNAFLCAEGPLHGKGYARFTTDSEVVDLLGDLVLTSLEELKTTRNNRKNAIVEWIIEAEKP
ncbi:Methyltransferase type 11 [Thiorhodococcus drewsii AZ1]|uniref:Methyltransferase type 11 n=1 Tax=Thiorhodococcus drewsii AZ1 TaxID=765913 RepID=G2E7E9_9GAMM|nr:class I SAM-dependent methyltransferase [Thiorhodococcus drewsii]EGV27988.1 Methyltransferase type 11 [Thiorhodococcus drewsii AZ1]